MTQKHQSDEPIGCSDDLAPSGAVPVLERTGARETKSPGRSARPLRTSRARRVADLAPALADSAQAQTQTPALGVGTDAATRAASDTLIADLMIEEEATRARGFSATIAAVSLVVGTFVLILGAFMHSPVGSSRARWICLSALAAMCAASLLVWEICRDPRRYTWSLHRAYGALLAVCVLAVEHHLGYFSPVPVAITLGIYFIAQSRDRVSATLLPALTIGTYAVLATLTAMGRLSDVGVFSSPGTGREAKLACVLAVSLVLVLTQRMAQLSRRSVLSALKKSHDALLVVAEREAQLEEAHQNLDHALKAGVGKAGHYTGELAGPYALQQIIGLGAMGEVYAAQDAHTGEMAAVKLLQTQVARRPDLVERFLREGKVCSGLDSRHVVAVHEVGCMRDGAPYMAMEYLDGEDLGARLRRDAHMPFDEVVMLAREAALGLQCAHAAGIVHRDLKPQNLFLAHERGGPTWKVLDFGMSKLNDSGGTLTAHTVVGTPAYMSPEQARGDDVDYRSDLFSLGIVLYRALTGRQAFSAPNTPEMLFEVVYRAPERPSALRAELPADVDLVFAIALAKDPGTRFQSATELAAALDAAVRGDLSVELRQRGEAAVEVYPWGGLLSDDRRLISGEVPARGGAERGAWKM